MKNFIGILLLALLSVIMNGQTIHKYEAKACLTRESTGEKLDTAYGNMYLDVDLQKRTATLTSPSGIEIYYVVSWGNDTLNGHKITAYNLSSTKYNCILLDPTTDELLFIPVDGSGERPMCLLFIEQYDSRFGWIKAENK